MDDAGNCHRVRMLRRAVTSNSAYGTPRTHLEATLRGASRVPYSAALETMRQLSSPRGELPRNRADALIQQTQQLATDKSDGKQQGRQGVLPPLRVSSPPDGDSQAAFRGHPVGLARTGGLFCPGEDSSVHQCWDMGGRAEPVWLPQNRGERSRHAASEARNAPAQAVVDVVGRGTKWTSSAMTIRGSKPVDARLDEPLARLQCVKPVFRLLRILNCTPVTGAR